MTENLKFIQVGELAKGITENILPHSDELTGRTFTLNDENGAAEQLEFSTPETLNWKTNAGVDQGHSGSAVYRVTAPRKGIFLLDYLPMDRRATSISRVIDLTTRSVTTVTGVLPTRAETRQDLFSRISQGLEPTSVGVQFVRASIDSPFDARTHAHAPSTDMIGKRIRYVYSRTEVYEHIYLNAHLYTWHCLAGVEKGLADTDRCHHYKIADGLYLFVWREKIVPTLGVVVIDLVQMKTTGKLFGYESGDFGTLTNAPIGAYAALVNTTTYNR